MTRISREEVLAALDVEQFYARRVRSPLKAVGKARWKAGCPLHPDDNPSLSIQRQSGLFKCFGCSASGSVFDFEMRLRGVGFLTALQSLAVEAGLASADETQGSRLVRTHKWRDANGSLVWEKLRYEPKDFRVRRPDGNGSWIWNIDGVLPMWYNADLIAAASEGDRIIWVFEGEHDADEGTGVGVLGTTTGSVTSWKPELAAQLAGWSVRVVPHQDAEGRRYGEQVASSLYGVAESIRIVRLPGMAHKGADFADWVAAGGTKDELLALAEAAPEWEPEESRPVAAVDVKPARCVVPAWPDSLAPEVLHGLAGDFVRLVEPHTEADPVALLVSLLAGFGNLVGDSAHFRVEFVKHPPRLNAVLVGDTAKARKGQSWATPRRLLTGVDPAWEGRVKEGLSSGEGLINQVRDQRTESQPVRKQGKVVEYQDVIVDQGVEDKRLLIVEQEFSQALKMMSREGNILSVTIRQAWDSGKLSPLTKTNPIEATGAHVSILGHITREELLRHLTETEQANGFANRFLWVLVRRSKFLPSPEPIPEATLSALLSRLKAAVEFAKGMGEMERDAEAEILWRQVYPQLSEGRPGLLGAITARAEAQTMRLALIYALLDCSLEIKVEHLRAGLALWRYCEQSAAIIFGDSLGDPKADRILRAIRETGGLAENDISNLFSRHDSAGIDRCLDLLHKLGLAHPVVVPTGGRPKTIWEPGDAREG